MEPADRKPSILRFDRVTVSFDGVEALRDLSFEAREGESRVILGAAGSGKTVLLKTALGLVRPDSGRVFVFGKKVDDFHVVDYDQLFSMNIGATQQLAAENENLRARLAALERAVTLLQQPK